MTEGHVVRDELAEGEAARLREMGVTVTGDEFFFTPALCATSSPNAPPKCEGQGALSALLVTSMNDYTTYTFTDFTRRFKSLHNRSLLRKYSREGRNQIDVAILRAPPHPCPSRLS